MITTAQLFHIILAGTLGYLVSICWYSQTLFGKPWMRGIHKTKEDLLTVSKKEMVSKLVYGFFVSSTTAFGLWVILYIFDVNTMLEAFRAAFIVAFSFVITSKFSDMLWTSREPHWSRVPQELFLVETGHIIATYSAMTFVLTILK